jgi:L-seryl-tRNA(Ser) seleniumtransferase
MPPFQRIPSIEEFLQRPAVQRAIDQHGRAAVTAAAREAAAALREMLRRGEEPPGPDSERAQRASPRTRSEPTKRRARARVGGAAGAQPPGSKKAEAMAWMEGRVQTVLTSRIAASLRRVINATGVIVHTNLGRAPLPAAACERMAEIGRGYCNLEYDLDRGTRGHRHVHAERLLCQLTGAEAAVVVNNNAAATLLVLAALAAGREVIVSRGELVEIGGGFRVPDVMAQSGAMLREVGTTNRTRIADYAAAISDRTAMILRVHPSNFRIEGFTERPALSDLAALAHRFQLPLFEDLGSGWLGEHQGVRGGEAPRILKDEPSAADSLAAGADVVAFSGDKLLGGPQAGLIVGRRPIVDTIRRHPLMRAVRADKLAYAALEATLAIWTQEPERWRVPVYRMLTIPLAELERRAQALAARLSETRGLRAAVVDGVSTVGGGSAPGSALPTRLVRLEAAGLSASALDARLRAASPPIVTRIENDRVVLDVRTIGEEEDEDVVSAVGSALMS